MDVGCEEADDLKEEPVRAVHDQRREHHGVGDQLGGDGEEEKAGRLAPLVLGGRVSDREDQGLEAEGCVDARNGVQNLDFVTAKSARDSTEV